MKKARILSLVLLLLFPLTLSADIIEDIAKMGNTAWDNLILLYKYSGWKELASVTTIADNFSQYKDKVMCFPLIDFSDVITDSKGNKYYYYGEKGGTEIVLFAYHAGIEPQIAALKSTLGDLGSRYEALGSVIDVQRNWGTWQTVIFMKLCAFHSRNHVSVVVENETMLVVGQARISAVKEEQALNWRAGIPEDAASVPPGLDPESVAKWFLFFGSTRKNLAVWTQLCSVQENAISSAGALWPKGRSWWQKLSLADREYRFIGADSANSNDTTQVFLCQISEKGIDVGEPIPISVVLEKAGQWRISNF
jgi:hypothetical protein